MRSSTPSQSSPLTSGSGRTTRTYTSLIGSGVLLEHYVWYSFWSRAFFGFAVLHMKHSSSYILSSPFLLSLAVGTISTSGSHSLEFTNYGYTWYAPYGSSIGSFASYALRRTASAEPVSSSCLMKSSAWISLVSDGYPPQVTMPTSTSLHCSPFAHGRIIFSQSPILPYYRRRLQQNRRIRVTSR